MDHTQVEKVLNSVQTHPSNEAEFPCRHKKGEQGCIRQLEDERDDEERPVFWYGVDCKAARERLCGPCLAYWLVACARNTVLDDLKLKQYIKARELTDAGAEGGGAAMTALQQAEKDLRSAAHAYVAAHAEFHRQWKLHNEHERYNGPRDANGYPLAPIHPETEIAVQENNRKRDALEAAARAYDAAATAARTAEESLLASADATVQS